MLDDKSVEYPFVRIERLYDRAVAFLEQVAGPEGEYYAGAVRIAEYGLVGFLEEGDTIPFDT